MYEVELKVRADHASVREQLSRLGATPRGTVEQTDTYYDAPHRDVAETDEALRLRIERSPEEGGESRAVLTYKGPLVESASKTRREAETVVADAPATESILTGLGFEPAAEVTKRRERYELEDYTVALDAVAGLGEFVEVETEAESDVASARAGAASILERLGLDPSDQIRTSYLELIITGNNSA